MALERILAQQTELSKMGGEIPIHFVSVDILSKKKKKNKGGAERVNWGHTKDTTHMFSLRERVCVVCMNYR